MTHNRIDSHTLLYHPHRVSEWLTKGDCFPIYVEIGLTENCNHKCIFCALDWVTKRGATIKTDVMLKALDDLASHAIKSIMFAGEGEPLLHKDVTLFVNHAKTNGLKVAITTNGVPFTQQIAETCLPALSWIRFSINAGTPDAYARIHGTTPSDFEKVMNNIAFTVEYKEKHSLDVDIGVQILVLPESLSTITRLAEVVKNLGVNNLQVKPYSKHPLSRNDLSVNQSEHHSLITLKSFESDHFKIFVRETAFQRLKDDIPYDCCHGLPFFALIDARGNVIPCNMFYGQSDYKYGNLYEKSFPTIWAGKRRARVLDILSKRGIKECRQICRLDVINTYLHRLKHPEQRDDFI